MTWFNLIGHNTKKEEFTECNIQETAKQLGSLIGFITK